MMTVEEVCALPDGAEVEITWSGGNGPHRYIIRHWYGGVWAECRGDLIGEIAAPQDKACIHKVRLAEKQPQ